MLHSNVREMLCTGQAMEQVSSNLGISLLAIVLATDAERRTYHGDIPQSRGEEGYGHKQAPAVEERSMEDFAEDSTRRGQRRKLLHREIDEDEEWRMRSEAEELLRRCPFSLGHN